MKEYQAPSLKQILLHIEDIIAESSVLDSIVSASDQSESDEIRMSDWNKAWN